MSLPTEQQLIEEKSFLIEKQAALELMIQSSLEKIKKRVDILETKKKQFIKAAKQIKQGFALLKKSKAHHFQDKLELNNLIEQLNSWIAHIQTISFSKAPSQTLHLRFLTRITAIYIKHHQAYLGSVKALYLNAREKNATSKNLDNKLFFLPENFNLLTSLEILQARYNRLNTLPDAFWHLQKLKALGLEGNHLQSLPASIGKLKSIEELGLDGNKLKSIPNEIGKLSKLKILGLNGNLLISLPDALKRLKQLMTLGLNNNFLFDLPDLSELTHLQTVGVKHNLLTAYPRLSSHSQVRVDVAKNAIKMNTPKPSLRTK